MSRKLRKFDSIVAGLGAMGAATTFHLSKHQLGSTILGIESRSSIPHTYGSSHGDSRIIRHIYQEDNRYIPLLTRSYQLFRDLEKLSASQILTITGCLNISSSDMDDSDGEYGHPCFEGALEAAKKTGLPFTTFPSSAEINQNFPGYRLPEGYKALHDPSGGFVNPEKTIEAHATLAKKNGATILQNTAILEYSLLNDNNNSHNNDEYNILVRTNQEDFVTKSLILTAGHHMPHLVPELKPLLQVERQVVGWFRPETSKLSPTNDDFSQSKFPVFLLDDKDAYYYGFPQDKSGLVKLGKYHHLNQIVENTQNMDYAVHAEDEQALRKCFEKYMPALAHAPMEKSSVCTFTNSPDGHFIIDEHPSMPGVLIASTCSGHGFKFAPVIGEILSQLALYGETQHDIDMFRLKKSRFDFN